jgi:hypothetical protein
MKLKCFCGEVEQKVNDERLPGFEHVSSPRRSCLLLRE